MGLSGDEISELQARVSGRGDIPPGTYSGSPQYMVRAEVRPRPKQRVVGSGAKAYTPRKTREFEKIVALEAKKKLPNDWPLDGLYELRVNATYETKKWADVSNVLKAVEDALNGVAYDDDRQILTARANKQLYRDGDARISFSIELLGYNPDLETYVTYDDYDGAGLLS